MSRRTLLRHRPPKFLTLRRVSYRCGSVSAPAGPVLVPALMRTGAIQNFADFARHTSSVNGCAASASLLQEPHGLR